MFTYALGRGTEFYDQRPIGDISSAWVTSGMRLRDLVLRIVRSDSFMKRRGEAATGGM